MAQTEVGAGTGLAGFAALGTVPAEEVRFCVVLNGGVSLAVWMGGTVLELDRLIKAGQGETSRTAYGLMLALAGATARADVIAGTSAGGINGAALALAQVNGRARVDALRDVWIDQGQIETLLRQPFRGAPSSLLRGDDFFLPELNAALTQMAAPLDWRSPSEAPIDLTIATTVLKGNQLVTTDALGQRLPQSLHAARLRWSRWPVPQINPATGLRAADPFSPTAIRFTAAQLALAARASASFPIAFEPTYVPVGENPATSPRSREDQQVRPDMESAVAAWGDGAGGRDRSRYAVDGGLLANTPTAYALKAIQAMPSAGPVRRVMLLVYPHAPEPGLDPADDFTAPPTIRDTVTGLLGSLTAQGGRTFVEEVEAHNRLAAGRRGTRSDILATVAGQGEEGLEDLARTLYPHYRRLRIWRAARDLSQRMVDLVAALPMAQQDQAAGWGYERIRAAAEKAQEWLDDGDARVVPNSPNAPRAQGMVVGLPYVPSTMPTGSAPDTGPGWGWGVTGAERIAEAVGDLLRRLVWVLPPGPDYDIVKAARETVSEAALRTEDARMDTDGPWDTDPVLLTLEPGQSYWAFRLGCYASLMLGQSVDGLDDLLAQIVAAEGNLVFERTQSCKEQDARRAAVQTALTSWLTSARERSGSAGATVRAQVDQVVGCLATVVPVLRRTVDRLATEESLIVADARLDVWRNVLAAGADPIDDATLLTRLLQLEVATTALGDEVATGTTLPVELVQLSAQTVNGFTRHTRTADDKLGGMSVSRFGGFLKRSWRLNDWIWGRLDAATVLALTVLAPTRLRRTAVLSGYLEGSGTPDSRAAATVQGLVAELFAGSTAAEDGRVVSLAAQARKELADCFDVDRVPPGDLPPSMPGLAGLFAWAVHLQTLPVDVPALVSAIRSDALDGANERSRGQFFLTQNADLLTRVTGVVEQHGADAVDPGDRVRLLEAFDRAGVGREPLEGELSSDLMLRTATTAAAVAATALDSPRSGFAAIRPVTRAIRGSMLVVFWGMTGLTAKSVIARSLALLGLALGAVLVALSVFGALPSAVSAPASAFGLSLILLAFAYGALRAGTMLHGLVLLTPLVPLVADAVDRTRSGTGSTSESTHGLVVVGAIVVLSLGLMLLGTLPAATASPYAALGALATKVGVPPVAHPSPTLWGHLAEGIVRRLKGIWRSVVELGGRILILAVPFVLAWWVVASGWTRIDDTLHRHLGWCIAVAVVLALVGLLVSSYTGFALQSLHEQRGESVVTWTFLRVAQPAGVQAGWSVLYGWVYLAVACVLVADPYNWHEALWARSLCAMALVLGVVLTLVVPVLAPLLALGRVRANERARAGKLPPFVASQADYDTEQPVPITPDRSYAIDLVHRDLAYRWWVDAKPGEVPTLKPRGIRMRKFVDSGRPPQEGSEL